MGSFVLWLVIFNRPSRKRGKREQQHDTDGTDTRMIWQGRSPLIKNIKSPQLRRSQRDRSSESGSVMIVIPVPTEAHGEIDRIALNYRKIRIESHGTVITKTLHKVVED
jgi:hypothetical protein